ncbi:leucine-rich repeat domain-containing protein [Alienimonas californiensis]|uniref:Leucine Rich repeats (2 copies) n=1 Tax=Alienimonas californiensis TaxID=2527989 RepID=A0A517PD82_9PLAN|nr:hypothetical protein [Alienimonas californiensis]QDT17329.1 Leucine Rich repeats (2 copies) [Alienimonas californiensis]
MPTAVLFAAVLLAFQEPSSGEPPQVPPLSDADRAAIAAVEALGGQVVQRAQNDARLDVSFHLGDVELTAKHLDALVPLADRLHELNLRGTPFDDGLSRKLTLLTNLRKLHLEGTKIGDAALVPVGTLERLEYLNLYGTKVTDAGLKNLRGLVALRSLYVWDTAVTTAGALALMKDLPEVQIVGVDLPPAPRTPLNAPKPAPETAPEEDQE